MRYPEYSRAKDGTMRYRGRKKKSSQMKQDEFTGTILMVIGCFAVIVFLGVIFG